MKQRLLLLVFTLFTAGALSAQINVSGVLDSTFAMQAAKSDFFCGMEEFANIRFQSQIQERASVFGAVNLFAAAGNYAASVAEMADVYTPPAGMSSTAYVFGDNYIAGIELERLYFRINGERTDFESGLFRLPFGYGQVWGPSDFLNPSNPLKPDARPRAVLGASLSWFPNDDYKLQGFYAAPRDAFSNKGKGSFLGLSLERHGENASFQILYSYEMPINASSKFGIHRAGFSVKADIKAGITLEALYTYNHAAKTEIDGLSACASLDYSFFEGKLIVLAEYLYNGETSSTAYDPVKNILGMKNRHNIYTGFTWRFSEITDLNIALVSSFKETSFTPIVTLNHDLFQGATLTFLVQVPIEKDISNDWRANFFGSVRLRLRF
jgi:hypothetical protein